MGNLYDNMNKKFSLSKTLRFELKPVGKTRENVYKESLEEDIKKSEKAKNIKKYCDEYYKTFIEKCLDNKKLTIDKLKKVEELSEIKNKTKEEKELLEHTQKDLRKEIVEVFTKNPEYNSLFKEKMINELIYNTLTSKDTEKEQEIELFYKFTSYFENFFKNRKNIFVNEDKKGSIAYRLINENLPIFLYNIRVYKEIEALGLNEIFENENYIKTGRNLKKIFDIENYNNCLTEYGIEDYNLIISGYADDVKNKIKGLNEMINEYNQQHTELNKKIPLFKQLYKQILSDKDSMSFKFEEILDDKSLVSMLEEYYKDFEGETLKQIKEIQNIEKFDLSKIYIEKSKGLNLISVWIFNNHTFINNLLSTAIDKKQDKSIYSLEFLNDLVLSSNENSKKTKVTDYFKNNLNTLIEDIKINSKNFFDVIQKYKVENNNLKSLINNQEDIDKIKYTLDKIKEIQNIVKMLQQVETEEEKDTEFYNKLDPLYNSLEEIIPIYNKTRNYLTKLPFSQDKIKLNFKSPCLLSGWDMNKENTSLGVILLRNNKYFLGIINKDISKKNIFDIREEKKSNDYLKMEYKLTKDIKLTIPKCSTQRKEVINHFKESSEDYILNDEKVFKKPLVITKEIFELNNCLYGEFKKFQIGYLNKTNDKEGYTQALDQWIEFCKEFLLSYKSTLIFDFNEVFKNKYTRLDEFYKDCNKVMYKIDFKNYSEEYINNLIDDGSLYLFEIYNKDFSEFSKGNPNLHTMYFKALFDEENLKNTVYKLNGQAEIFYRKASLKLKDTVIHMQNTRLDNKNPLNEKKTSIFGYELIKNKRYTQDKFFLHLPITLNFGVDEVTNINEDVNNYIRNNNDFNIISIARGERNLVYIMVLNSKSEILEQIPLNKIENNYKNVHHVTDYNDLLEHNERFRDNQRKDWKKIENIKNVKKGYLSQVIHTIIDLMVKYNALVVIEDINQEFKNSRAKIEKNIYQSFEKALIEKLNYVVFKNVDKNRAGGLYNAYQLANKLDSISNLYKQSGVIFSVPTYYISTIDPSTGFINLLDTEYRNLEKSKEYFNKFKAIRYNKEKDYFEFDVDYSVLTDKKTGPNKEWTICTNGERIEQFRDITNKNNWSYRKVNLTLEFKTLFKGFNIDYESNDLKEEILKQESKEFFVNLYRLLKLTVQMKNAVPNEEIDYLISPVLNKEGKFYDSRDCNKNMPTGIDSNKAYNIARKGLMYINQIQETKEGEKVIFRNSVEDWLSFVQK